MYIIKIGFFVGGVHRVALKVCRPSVEILDCVVFFLAKCWRQSQGWFNEGTSIDRIGN